MAPHKMNDHDLIIRIDERQKKMTEAQDKTNEVLDQILLQCRQTNGRVTGLEDYQNDHTQEEEAQAIVIGEHEKRLDAIDKRHDQLNGGWKTIVIIASVVGGLGGLGTFIYEVIKHSHA